MQLLFLALSESICIFIKRSKGGTVVVTGCLTFFHERRLCLSGYFRRLEMHLFLNNTPFPKGQSVPGRQRGGGGVTVFQDMFCSPIRSIDLSICFQEASVFEKNDLSCLYYRSLRSFFNLGEERSG